MDKVKSITKSKLRIFLISLLCVFVVIVVWGYCFEQEKDPVRVVFITKGGPVVFEHFEHASPDGYELECESCHHNYSAEEAEVKAEDEDSLIMNCRQCHYTKENASLCEDADVHKRCIGENCMECHEEKCEYCHKQSWK